MAIMSIGSLLYILPIVLCMHFTFITGQRFTLRGQSYPNHGLVLIDEIGETDMTDLNPNNGLNCVSDLSDCCISGMSLRGEFDFPDGSVVPTLGGIRNGYYRGRGGDRNILNRQADGMTQGLFQCRIRTQASQTEYEEFYIGVYDESSGVPIVDSVSTSGLNLTCTSSGGPATSVTWRRNCAALPNNAMYQQTQTVTQTQTATYQNTLVINSAVTDRDGVYTCSVTNARGYSNGNTGLGASYDPSLPFTVTITPSSLPVAGASLSLTCASTASIPTYQWFNETDTMIGTENTLTLNPLLESHSGEYSCLVTDGAIVGCGVHRVTVQAPSVTVTVRGVDGVTAGSTSQTLTCSVSGVNLTATAVTSVMYTWLHDGSVVQAASTSNQYTIPSMSLGVNNAGDEYTCQVAITASYWDVSGSFGGSGSGILSLMIPDPTVRLSELPLVSSKYVGLNFTWRCDVTLPGQLLIGVNAVVEWKKSDNNLTSSSDGRITVGDLVIDTPGRIYRRSVIFSPLSTDDVASYSCSATVMPTVANPQVTNGFRSIGGSLAVTVPTLDVSIDRAGVLARIIDASPFNGFHLICMVTSRVANVETAIRKQITWTRSVNGGLVQQLTDGASVDNVVMVMGDNPLQARSMSMLMVNTSVSGNHSYTCRAELVVAPAPDDISAQNQTTITVARTSPPVEPMGVMAVDITRNSATIRWTVSSLSYDPEIYVVQYGVAMDSLNMTSSMVMGDVTPLNYMDSYQGSVTLTGLNRLTTYFYRVMSTNSDSSTTSVVGTFNTSGLAPEPPTMLQCSQVPLDPLSFICNWMAPTATNGVLTGYELTCVPGLKEIPPPPVATSSMTSATVSSLRNGVNYTCTVRARNENGLSPPSDPASFYTTQSAPTGPPLEFMIVTLNSREMRFMWQLPNSTLRNGLITGYNVTCFIQGTGMGQISIIYPPQESYRLSGFRPGTQYTCRVVAINSAGSGPPAEGMSTSPEDVPDGPPQNIQFELRGLDEVMFSWTPPLEELRNGIIMGYIISCIDIGRARDPIIRTVTGELSRMETVSGFTPATQYNCSLAARTSIGAGVNGTLLVLTRPDRPVILQVTTEARSLLAMWTYTNPAEGAVINGYHVYIDGSLHHTITTNTTSLNVTVTGLTPFTNYTVEVSAFNTRGDGTVQEGPRSDPTTETTLGEVPGPPVCPQRWTIKSLSSLTIDWQPPTQPNGVITGYFLELVSYDNQTVLQSGSESGRLSHRYTGFTIAAGVPYQVRVYAENTNGRGSYCITTDFGDQLTPPNNILNNFSSSYGPTDSSSVLLTWTVLPLDKAKGFIILSITFGPLVAASKARQKRQTTECSQSPCQVPYEQGRVSIAGLNSQQSYFIIVVPQNEEGEIGTPIALGIPAVIEQQSPISRVATNNSTVVIAGVSAVIVVLALLLFVAMVVIVILSVQLRKHKHSLSYKLPVATFSRDNDNKADIITSQCEAYEVMKLQEMPQGHAHTDARQEQAYEEVTPHLFPESKSNQESITKSSSKIAQNDQGGDTSGGSHYERAGTYERIHHCDIPPHLLTQMKQSKELVVVDHDQPATLTLNEDQNAAIATYERIHHCDISPNMLPLSKPSQDQDLVNVEHSVPLNKKHKETEGEGEDHAHRKRIQHSGIVQSSKSFATPNSDNPC